jgi:hypothetical protein
LDVRYNGYFLLFQLLCKMEGHFQFQWSLNYWCFSLPNSTLFYFSLTLGREFSPGENDVDWDVILLWI